MTPLQIWLDELGLSQYLPMFEQNGIDLQSLPMLAESDLTQLGVLLGHRKRLMKAIGELGTMTTQHVPPVVTSNLNAERRQLTVMFCDLVGSTAMSQSLDPEALRELMQIYQQTCANVVKKYAGHVAQYLGDGLMVYFGWPEAHEDDAERAVRAGLEIVAAVKCIVIPQLHLRHSVSPAPTGELASQSLSVRIGIATGPVVVGETGNGDAAIPKTAIGETPNLAARMQALAQPNQVLLAPSTQRLLGTAFRLTDTGQHVIKGFPESLHVWLVDGERTTSSRFETRTTQLTPYVGRDAELHLLATRWEQSVLGEGQIVLLSGEPGIGKSRICEMAGTQARPEPLRIRFQCSPYYTGSGLYPIIQHFSQVAGIEREDSPQVKLDKIEASLALEPAELPMIGPLMAALLSLPIESYQDRYPARMLSPQKQKELTLEAIVTHVANASRRSPVMILFEDVHWIDPTSLDLLGLLIDSARRHAILLLVTYRPEFVAPWIGQSQVTTINLSRLSRRQGTEVVLKVTGDKPLPDEVLEQILARTDGVPLFIEELTTTIIEAGFLQDAGTHYNLSGTLPLLAIPATLQDSLMARLDRLGDAKEVAQVAACIGREFRRDWLLTLGLQTESIIDGALEKLISSGLVYIEGTPPDADYSFKHALVQQAAYGSLLNKRRQEIHRHIAQTLQVHFADTVAIQPELLARHLTDAEEYDAALPHWLAGAQLGLLNSRHKEALAHVDSGLAIVEHTKGLQRKNLEAALLATGASCHFALGGYGSEPAGKLLARAEAMLDDISDADTLVATLLAIASYSLAHGEFPRARMQHERLRHITEGGGNLDRQLLGCAGLGIFLTHCGEFSRAKPLLEFVIDHYDMEQHGRLTVILAADLKVMACMWLNMLYVYSGFPDKARQFGDIAIAHAAQISHPFSMTAALSWTTCNNALLGENKKVVREAGECIVLCQEQLLPFWMGWALFAEAANLLWEGAVSEAEVRLSETIAHNAMTGTKNARGAPYALRAIALAKMGRFAEAHTLAQDGYAATIELGELAYLPLTLYARGIVYLEDPSADNALAVNRFLESISEARKMGNHLDELRSAIALAGLWRTQGKAREAHDLLAPIYAWFTEGFDCAPLQEAAALLAELEALRA